MDIGELLRKEYLERCANSSNHGGYTKLESDKEEIRQDIIDRYGINGNKEKIRNMVMTYEKIVFSFLEELAQHGIKHYMWITDFHEKELNRRLNIALQEG
jgi:hypothetical protein